LVQEGNAFFRLKSHGHRGDDIRTFFLVRETSGDSFLTGELNPYQDMADLLFKIRLMVSGARVDIRLPMILLTWWKRPGPEWKSIRSCRLGGFFQPGGRLRTPPETRTLYFL
jgi:hypothetical protein